MKAILSDIHANIAAIDAVMKDIRSHGISDENIICLGDIVGYGPDPVECVDIAMNFRTNLMGNHDEAVVFEPMGFNIRALTAIRWTKHKLEPGLLSFANKKRIQFLKDLKITHREEGVMFVHGSPRQPTTEYILRGDVEDANLGRNENKMKEICAKFDSVLCVAHTHIPCVIEQIPDSAAPTGFRYIYKSDKDLNYEFCPEPGKKYILNDGAVGQPRDGDPRACYVLWDGDTYRWVRLEYDFRKTMDKIYKIKELDDYNADRLEIGA
ncbi:MAG: metallophosphoesterase [Planctomycetaceae bacterium]|nr:metallophosphoesterase [Planctomycetaceae bacterium]